MAVNVLTGIAGFITGPLQARALGPAGRGDLAAILVPLNLAPLILGLSLGAYTAREAARGRPVGELAGSLGAVALAVGLLGAAAAVPTADLLANGRDTVELFLTISFLLLPLTLVAGVVYSMLGGLERWRMLVALRAFPVVLGLVGIVALYALGRLTVGSAAAVVLVGALGSCLPPFLILRGERLRFRRDVAWEGTKFGVKNWAGGLASVANYRLDQLLMIRLVSPKELGLYAVAVTLASVPTFLTGALGPPLLTRIARGDRVLVQRAMRVTLTAVIAADAVVAAATPFILPLLFGSAFADAVDMTLVLLLASIPLAGIVVLSTALVADGSPGIPSVGEALALVVTVAGLLVLLDPLGGLGAAIVSLAAYALSFIVQLIAVRRRFGGSFRDYLAPRRGDFTLAYRLLRRRSD